MNVDGPVRVAATGKQIGYRPLPERQQVPYGWRALAVGRGSHLQLEFDHQLASLQQGGWLRLAVLLDKRADVGIGVYYADSEEKVGDLNLKVPYMYQMVEMELSSSQCGRALRDGVELRLIDRNTGLDDVDSAVWFYAGDGENGLEYFQPHIVLRGQSKRGRIWYEGVERLCSYASLQPFGWMEGCVLESLLAVQEHLPQWRQKARAAIDAHLNLSLF